jgi:hypothetical protein
MNHLQPGMFATVWDGRTLLSKCSGSDDALARYSLGLQYSLHTSNVLIHLEPTNKHQTMEESALRFVALHHFAQRLLQ